MKTESHTFSFVLKQNWIKCLLLLVLFGMSFTVVASDDVVNTRRIDKIVWLINQISGNALWDIIKLILQLLIFVLFPLFLLFWLFSQWFHVQLFLYGRCDFLHGIFYVIGRLIPNFWGKEKFGSVVKDSDKKDYRKFYSKNREVVINEMNADSRVFLVMGPTGVGKRLLTFCESNAKYILKLARDEWYDPEHLSVKDILKERINLLVSHLLWKKSISIVLMWDKYNVGDGAQQKLSMPNQDKMNNIISFLAQLLAHDKYSKVSFILVIPAYYQNVIMVGEYCGDKYPKNLLVNRLDGLECKSLLKSELERIGLDSDAEIDRYNEEAKKRFNMNLEKQLWVETLGLPADVIRFLSRKFYGSFEVWKKLQEWWRELYDGKDNDQWFAFLYIIALKSMMTNEPVNAKDLAGKIYEGEKTEITFVENALERMGLRQRPDSTKANSNDFKLTAVNAEILFEDKYVIERFVLFLGGAAPLMASDSYGNKGIEEREIFQFADKIPEVMSKAFNLDDPNDCDKIAEVYWKATDSCYDLISKLDSRYKFPEYLKDVFGIDHELTRAYYRKQNDFTWFQKFVSDLTVLLPSMSFSQQVNIFGKINKILMDHNSFAEYARLTLEMLPAYCISNLFVFDWGVDFDKFIHEMSSKSVNYEVKLKCAFILCVAYISFENYCRICPVFTEEERKLYSKLISIYEKIQEDYNNNDECQLLFQIMEVFIERKTLDNISNFNIQNVSSDARIALLCVLSKIIRAFDIDENETKIVSSLVQADWKGGAGILLDKFRSNIIYCDLFDINTDDGVESIKQSIEKRKQEIKQGMNMNNIGIALNNYISLCFEYMCFYNNGKQILLESNMLNDMYDILHSWRTVLSDINYSEGLRYYTMLVKCVSDNNGSNNDLIKIWDDLGFSIEMFYGNITMFNLNSICDDYFAIFSLISNIKAIPIDQRKNLLNKIALTGSFFQINARYIEMAWSVYECNSELVPPHKKIFWCAMFFAGKVPEYCPDDNDVSEMIRVAIGLIQEARSDRSRCVDEDLVKKLYEANGISA